MTTEFAKAHEDVWPAIFHPGSMDVNFNKYYSLISSNNMCGENCVYLFAINTTNGAVVFIDTLTLEELTVYNFESNRVGIVNSNRPKKIIRSFVVNTDDTVTRVE